MVLALCLTSTRLKDWCKPFRGSMGKARFDDANVVRFSNRMYRHVARF